MGQQLDIFGTGQVRSHLDREAALAARDGALEAVAANRQDVVSSLESTVMAVATSVRDFTSDDVWAALGDRAGEIGEPRVLGSVMRGLAKRRRIRATGLYRTSERPACHARPVRVWRATGERD